MKLSTYIIGGAFLAGLALTVTGAATMKTRDNCGIKSHWDESAEVALPAEFKAIKVTSQPTDYEYWIHNLNGITITTSDSISAPVLHTEAGFGMILSQSLQGETLVLTIDPENWIDSEKKNSVYGFYIDESWPITIELPAGMTLDYISSADYSVALHHLDYDRLTVDTDKRLLLYQSNIDELKCPRGKIEELKLDQSSIAHAIITGMDDDFRINTCKGTGKISSLSINTETAPQ